MGLNLIPSSRTCQFSAAALPVTLPARHGAGEGWGEVIAIPVLFAGGGGVVLGK